METQEQRPVRHLGLYRSVSIREARLDGCVLRTLWRKDYKNEGLTEGALSHLVGKKITDEAWIACTVRLQDWKMVEIVPGYHGDARRVELTPVGRDWAIELCGERQLAGQPVDGE